jgi:hypothetical protein
MTDFFNEDFKKRFNYFQSHATNIHIIENSFTVVVKGVPEKWHVEFNKLQKELVFRAVLMRKL